MSEIFLVEDPEQTLSVPLVVKRLAPFLLKRRYIEMFLREAKISSELNHKNVVRCFESGYDGDMPYLVLEYLEGMTVKELAQRAWTDGRELEAATVAEILKQSAQGLAAIHEKKSLNGGGLVHRDISPENLFVTAEGVVKVLDLGIARGTEATEFTKTGELKGKIPYMSPEQVNGDPLDARSDLFSLGVTAYWLLTKSRPFSRASDVHTLNAILNDPPARFSAGLVKSNKLENLVYKMLEKAPSQRVQNATDIVKACGDHNAHLLVALQESVKHIDVTDLETFDYSTTRNLKPSLVGSTTNGQTPATQNVIEIATSNRSIPTLVAMIGGTLLLILAAFFLLREREEVSEPPIQTPQTHDMPEVQTRIVAPPPRDAGQPPSVNDPESKSIKPLAKKEPKPKTMRPKISSDKPAKVQNIKLLGPPSLFWMTPSGDSLSTEQGMASVLASESYVLANDKISGVRSKITIKNGVADYTKHPEGKLVVRALPYAQVRHGQKSLGVTPFAPAAIKAGKVEVILEYENKTIKKWVVIEPGKTTTLKHNFNSH